MVIEQGVLDGLKKRFPEIHPLIFHRSVEKANSPGELFDILDTFSPNYPIIWSEEQRCWVYTKDLVQVSKFDLGGNR